MFRHTYETIKEFIDNKTHFELLQDYFIDIYTPLKLKCKECNREYYVTFTNLRMAVSRGRINCEECYKFERELPKILDYFKTKGEGCELVIDRSKNLHKDYLEIICPKCNGHFLNKYNDFKNKVHKMCNDCMNNDKSLPTNTLTYEKVKERIENNSECLLISTEYKNSKTPLEILCSCKQHTFFTTLPSFENGKTRCKECSTEYRRSLKTYTYEQVLDFVNSTNCKLITTEYINAQIPMDFTCEVDGCNETFTTTYNIFKNSGRRKCTKHSYEEVGRKNALTYDYVKEYIENLGSKLLSDIYINNSEKIEVICTECKTPYFTTFAEISTKNRVRCGACGNKAGGEAQLISYDKIKSTIEKEGCILLSKEYKGANEPLEILCSCGKHNFTTSYVGFRHGKKKCDYCVGQIRWDYLKVKEFVESNSDCILLSTKYINTHTKLDFLCSCGNKFSVDWHDFYDDKRKKRHCSECSTDSILEQTCIEILNKYKVDFEYQKIYPDCKFPETNGQLKYDFYLPVYNLILETHGYQHDHPSKFCSTMTDEEAEFELIKRKERDKFKEEYAIKNNYDFMVIWYYEIRKMEEIIKSKLKLN